MSGNEASRSTSRSLRAIAESRYADAMNTWPNHENYHSRTIMGARLFDGQCLRCWLERTAAEKINKEIDDKIDEWHSKDDGKGQPLYKYLGMTKEQYAEWVTRCSPQKT